MDKTEYLISGIFFFLSAAHTGSGLYLISDYYLDPSHSSLFGGACGKTIFDECSYVTSHINNLYIANYGVNKDCLAIYSTESAFARYHIVTKHFNLQPPDSNGYCINDYVEFYDGPSTNGSDLYGRFCGSQEPNFTGFPTQQYLTIRFHSDPSESYTGFKLMLTRHQTEQPCIENQFHCTHENTCIAGVLWCDGTEQCADGLDESSCTGWQQLVGAFLRLGVGGLMGVGLGIVAGCCSIWITVCICNWCPCCPLYKRKKKKEVVVKVTTTRAEADKPNSRRQKHGSAKVLYSSPPKYGQKGELPDVYK